MADLIFEIWEGHRGRTMLTNERQRHKSRAVLHDTTVCEGGVEKSLTLMHRGLGGTMTPRCQHSESITHAMTLVT